MRTLAFSVLLLIGVPFNVSQQAAFTPTKEASPCKVEITLAKSSYGATEPIKIVVRTTNITKANLSLGHDLSNEPQYLFDIYVHLASDGKLAPLTRAGRGFLFKEAIDNEMVEITLVPGASLDESVDLRKLYDLGLGQYTVQLKEGKFITNTVAFTVQPPQS